MARVEQENRLWQVVAGGGLVLGTGVAVCATLVGWRYLPGILGEWTGTMIGALTSPFLLEFSFAVLGLCLVVGLNHWRRKRAGDEFVVLDQLECPVEPQGLPDHARWAVLPGAAPPGEQPSLLSQAEGALAIGDLEQAAECLAAMGADDLRAPATLALRVELARAAGRPELAETLERQLTGGNQGV